MTPAELKAIRHSLALSAAANARRVVACVNALAGIPHPEHLPELIKALGLLDYMTTPEPIFDGLAKLRGEG